LENNKIYLYDSFGRNPERLLPILNQNLGGNIYFEDVKEQRNEEMNCGQRCMAWLFCAHVYGIKNAIKI